MFSKAVSPAAHKAVGRYSGIFPRFGSHSAGAGEIVVAVAKHEGHTGKTTHVLNTATGSCGRPGRDPADREPLIE